MQSDTVSVCRILRDFVTSEAESLSNSEQTKAIKSPELNGIYSNVLLRRLWKKYNGQ